MPMGYPVKALPKSMSCKWDVGELEYFLDSA